MWPSISIPTRIPVESATNYFSLDLVHATLSAYKPHTYDFFLVYCFLYPVSIGRGYNKQQKSPQKVTTSIFSTIYVCMNTSISGARAVRPFSFSLLLGIYPALALHSPLCLALHLFLCFYVPSPSPLPLPQHLTELCIISGTNHPQFSF